MSNKNKTTVLKVLIERVHSLKNGGKLNEAIRTAQTAVDTARRLIATDPEQALNLITSLELFGDLLRESNNYADAESIYIEALEQTKTANSDNEQLARIKSSLASVYDFNQSPEPAIALYQEAIELFTKLDPPSELDVANLRNNLGMLYKENENFDSAEKNYMKSLEIFERILGQDNAELAVVYNNLGTLYYSSGFFAQAR